MSDGGAAGALATPGAPDVAAIADQVAALLAGPQPMPIVQVGHPVLRAHAVPYEGQLDDATLAALVAAMRATMHAAPGVGLAAPQVGLGLAIAVIEDSVPMPGEMSQARERTPVPFRVLVNPRYEPVGTERVAFYEGCLSMAGYQAVRARWRQVRLTCTDEHGAPVDEVLAGWPARIVQHETDHLAGELYVDRAELRSLLAPSQALRYAADTLPGRAAAELGFPLP